MIKEVVIGIPDFCGDRLRRFLGTPQQNILVAPGFRNPYSMAGTDSKLISTKTDPKSAASLFPVKPQNRKSPRQSITITCVVIRANLL